MRHRLTSGETPMLPLRRGIAREPDLASTSAFG